MSAEEEWFTSEDVLWHKQIQALETFAVVLVSLWHSGCHMNASVLYRIWAGGPISSAANGHGGSHERS